jgi:REP-associated tyrosine transposase
VLQKNRHSIYDLEYHLVVVTKYRHPVIADSLKERLIELSYDLFIAKWNLKIIEINSDMDHIHILFEGSPQVQLSKLVNNYKTVTSRLIRKEFGESLKPYYWKPYFWSSSYFICTVSDRSHEQVKRYILDQSIK